MHPSAFLNYKREEANVCCCYSEREVLLVIPLYYRLTALSPEQAYSIA